jgi:hypothetical protein
LFWICFTDLKLFSITFNILAPTSDISFITRSCNCSYQHLNLFNEFVDKYGRLDKNCWTIMFNVECIVKPLILKAFLFVDVISKALFLWIQKICFYWIIIMILEL